MRRSPGIGTTKRVLAGCSEVKSRNCDLTPSDSEVQRLQKNPQKIVPNPKQLALKNVPFSQKENSKKPNSRPALFIQSANRKLNIIL